MRKFTAAFILLILIMVALGAQQQAAAQTETPTSTPETSEIIEIDGDHLRLDYTVSLGDIAVVIVGLFISGILAIYAIFRIVTTYIK